MSRIAASGLWPCAPPVLVTPTVAVLVGAWLLRPLRWMIDRRRCAVNRAAISRSAPSSMPVTESAYSPSPSAGRAPGSYRPDPTDNGPNIADRYPLPDTLSASRLR